MKLKKFIYQTGTKTVRSAPENHWIGTIRNGILHFDSWDGAIKGRINKPWIFVLWILGQIKIEKP